MIPLTLDVANLLSSVALLPIDRLVFVTRAPMVSAQLNALITQVGEMLPNPSQGTFEMKTFADAVLDCGAIPAVPNVLLIMAEIVPEVVVPCPSH